MNRRGVGAVPRCGNYSHAASTKGLWPGTARSRSFEIMNAVVQQALRQREWRSSEPALLAPESCHVMPSGNRMPLLGLGTRELNFHTADTVCNALEMGFRMLDNSPGYHTQRGIGDAIRACGFERHDIYVITHVESHA